MPHTHTPPTATAQFYVQLCTECPTCGESVDLLELLEERGDDPIPIETRDTYIHIECPGCTSTFIVNHITY